MQFVSVVTEKIDYKSINIFTRDFSTFSEGSFRDDVSIQNFNNHFEDLTDKFNDFYFKLEGCVERHSPLKKLTPKEIKLESKPWIASERNKMIKIGTSSFNRRNVNPIMKIIRGYTICLEIE